MADRTDLDDLDDAPTQWWPDEGADPAIVAKLLASDLIKWVDDGWQLTELGRDLLTAQDSTKH